jgi:hypothetical protein
MSVTAAKMNKAIASQDPEVSISDFKNPGNHPAAGKANIKNIGMSAIRMNVILFDSVILHFSNQVVIQGFGDFGFHDFTRLDRFFGSYIDHSVYFRSFSV